MEVAAVAPSVEVYALARGALGVAYGGVWLVPPLMIVSETCDGGWRTFTNVTGQMGWELGFCLLLLASLALPGWRELEVLILACGCGTALVTFSLVESPVWLILQGREGEAEAILAALGVRENPDSPLAQSLSMHTRAKHDRHTRPGDAKDTSE